MPFRSYCHYAIHVIHGTLCNLNGEPIQTEPFKPVAFKYDSCMACNSAADACEISPSIVDEKSVQMDRAI